MKSPDFTLVIPVYKNSSSLVDLVQVVEKVNESLAGRLEVVFVVDGSPDDCSAKLSFLLPKATVRSSLVNHSRNFGSFAAIRTGLAEGAGRYFAVLAADLQEPPELVGQFFRSMEVEECEVALGVRTSRADPGSSKVFSSIFWTLYRKYINPDIPKGGVDVFGCTREVRDQLLRFGELNSSLIAQLFWVGFKRKFFEYERSARHSGSSSWTFQKKVNYMMDSIFSFTDLPVRALLGIGLVGVIASVVLGIAALAGKIFGWIPISGYAALMITTSFFGASIILGMGIIGSYAHRTYENTKGRPISIVAHRTTFGSLDSSETGK